MTDATASGSGTSNAADLQAIMTQLSDMNAQMNTRFESIETQIQDSTTAQEAIARKLVSKVTLTKPGNQKQLDFALSV